MHALLVLTAMCVGHACTEGLLGNCGCHTVRGGVGGAEETDMPITVEDMTAARDKIQPSVSSEDIKRYVDWSDKFGAT